MGILDSKTRILDTILTDEGRRQLGTGKFVPMFYSFSDAGAVYSPLDTYVSGTAPSDNISTIISFEAFPLPQDQVAYEADDSGGLQVFGNNNYFTSSAGTVRVISGKVVNNWQAGYPEVLTSSANFASVASNILEDASNNFRKLMIIKSPDILYTNRDSFVLNKNNVQFRVTDNTTMGGGVTVGNLEATENLFSDRKLSHIDNFMYMPPVNKQQATPIGDYSSAVNGNRQIVSYQDLKNEFQNIVVANGTVNERTQLQRETIYFSETSITNKLMGQVFEIAQGKITKLDVIDFGVFTIRKVDPPLFPDAVPTPLNPDLVTATTRIHVYFVGKVMRDSTGNDKFLNLMSLVFQ
jgi:hypothetical protein